MKIGILLTSAILISLIAGVMATLIGGLVSNPTGFEGLDGFKSIYIDSESYGWPVQWRIHSDAAGEAGIGSGGVSISSLVFSTALWFWTILAALVLGYTVIRRHWIGDLNGFQIACLLSFGIASLITIAGTLSTSSGTWHSGRGFEINYESAGWPFEWKTNPALPVSSSVYEDGAQSYHESMHPYKVLGFSPGWLAMNWLTIAFPAAIGSWIAGSSWRAIKRYLAPVQTGGQAQTSD